MLKKGMLGAAFALLVAGAGAFAQKQQVMLDKVAVSYTHLTLPTKLEV